MLFDLQMDIRSPEGIHICSHQHHTHDQELERTEIIKNIIFDNLLCIEFIIVDLQLMLLDHIYVFPYTYLVYKNYHHIG